MNTLSLCHIKIKGSLYRAKLEKYFLFCKLFVFFYKFVSCFNKGLKLSSWILPFYHFIHITLFFIILIFIFVHTIPIAHLGGPFDLAVFRPSNHIEHGVAWHSYFYPWTMPSSVSSCSDVSGQL